MKSPIVRKIYGKVSLKFILATLVLLRNFLIKRHTGRILRNILRVIRQCKTNILILYCRR
jgi:hypothetical protein